MVLQRAQPRQWTGALSLGWGASLFGDGRLIRGGRRLESPPMASSQGIGTSGTRVLSPLIALIGVAILVRTLLAGGGIASSGVILGVIFIALGLGRLWLSLRASG
jgi:hypothetical protein